jgi:hypothetical protein
MYKKLAQKLKNSERIIIQKDRKGGWVSDGYKAIAKVLFNII